MLTDYVALLRAVNVGGNNRLPMKDLRQLFVAAGCEQVTSYIQSGNVLFRAEQDAASRLPSLLAAQIEARFGHCPPVLLRTRAQLAGVVRNNPYLAAGAEDSLYVMFLADKPIARNVERLDPDRSPPGTFLVRGQEIYLHLPRGAGNTKLTNAYFDSRLATVSTVRNWRTVTTLLALLSS